MVTSKMKRRILMLLIVFTWIFSGWPRIFNFPPGIQEAQADTVTITASQTWTAPEGVISVDAECWGGGGAGGGGTNNSLPGGSGGGGGAYAKKTISVTPNTRYTVTVGAAGTGSTKAGTNGGDTTFTGDNSIKCQAKGGRGGAVNGGTPGVGGLASASDGTIKYDGGGGYKVPSGQTYGGGGGGSGGTGSVGNTATSQTRATAVTGGGPGGNGGSVGVNGSPPASGYGGGGGGGGRRSGSSEKGGAGYGGKVVLTYTVVLTPTFEQAAYRFFNNLDSTDVGTVLADQDASATLGSTGALFRLRMNLHIGASQLAINGQQFKLQYVGKGTGTCASPSGGTPETYTDVTTSTLIAYNSQTPDDGVALTANTNDPIHNGDTFTKLADPTGGLPPSNGKGAAFSADGVYLAIASEEVSPYLAIYKRSGDDFAKLINPTNLPAGSGRGAAFSSDGVYLAIAHYVTPYVTIYKRDGDAFIKLADPTGGLPTGLGMGVAFSTDGTYLAVAHTTTPFVTIYKRTGDDFAKLDDPTGGLPTADCVDAAFSADGTYLAVTPGSIIYKRSGDTFTKLTTLDSGNGVAFSDDGVYFAVACSSTPFISIYKRTGDTFDKLTDPGGLPANIVGKRVAFSSDGVYLALFHHETPYVSIYSRSGDTFTKLTNPTSLPPGHGYSGAFSADGVYLAVGHQNSPYVSIYKGVANQTYEEVNNFTNSISAIPAGMDGKWDFALKDNSAPANTTYCFRCVKSDDTPINTYTVYPQITTATTTGP